MRAAKSRFKRERERKIIISSQQNIQTEEQSEKPRTENNSILINKGESTPVNNNDLISNEQLSRDTIEIPLDQCNSQPMKSKSKNRRKKIYNSLRMMRKGFFKDNAEMKREHKAWRTLAIITGTFVACWTPFFLISLYRPICRCKIPILLEIITSWLGYLNSALNPIIYTVLSNDFRTAFKRILSRLLFLERPRL
ncbi:unnamed protein product [Onchocerca ochengi]|uniref:G_PROTEIN_RECEP_F1_2 domain-containing protein n=1 Tax=Onchocerca ochengi TaxID=42157 RepID=A0A182ENY2_ONCOC|nr:unnamed protein product [Onchocerca ochengi]